MKIRNVNKLTDKQIFELAIKTKYFSNIIMNYYMEIANMLGTSQKVSKQMLKIHNNFENYKSDLEEHLWHRLDEIAKKKGIKARAIFYGDAACTFKQRLINKFINDILNNK
jgi:hypothetical protein